MKALVLLSENTVVQVEHNSKTFPVHEDFAWFECPDDCESGWTYDGSRFSPPAPYPRPTLEELKAEKHTELRAAFDEASENAHCVSSVGFEINAGSVAKRDIDGLIERMEYRGLETEMFRAYDNTFHQVTLEQLKMMRIDVIDNGNALYQRKWTLEAQIQACTTVDELDAINIDFEV